MKSRNKKRLLALVLCMVVAISNSSFIFASETGQAEYPQEAEVQTQDEAVADDMDVAAYAADEGQAVADEQPAPVEQVAEEPVAEPETTAAAQAAAPYTALQSVPHAPSPATAPTRGRPARPASAPAPVPPVRRSVRPCRTKTAFLSADQIQKTGGSDQTKESSTTYLKLR